MEFTKKGNYYVSTGTRINKSHFEESHRTLACVKRSVVPKAGLMTAYTGSMTLRRLHHFNDFTIRLISTLHNVLMSHVTGYCQNSPVLAYKVSPISMIQYRK